MRVETVLHLDEDDFCVINKICLDYTEFDEFQCMRKQVREEVRRLCVIAYKKGIEVGEAR